MINLKGKNILVTGSTKGIGFAIAQELVSLGAVVIFNGRDEQKIEQLKLQYPGHFFFTGDLTELDICKKLADYISLNVKNLDGIVCNIGSGTSVAPGNETHVEWQRVLNVNLFSATNTIEYLKEKILSSKSSIVFISSICGLEALGAPLTYSASKAALNSYTVGLAKVWGKFGVRVNAVAPGNILFEGSVWEKKLNEDSIKVEGMLKSEVALNRLGKPEEIANVVSFLLSNKSSFVSGIVMAVDGGQIKGV